MEDVAVNGPDSSNMNTPNLAVVSLTAVGSYRQPIHQPRGYLQHSEPSHGGRSLRRSHVDRCPGRSQSRLHGISRFGTTSQSFVQRSNTWRLHLCGCLGAPRLTLATEPSVGTPTGNIAGQIKVDRSSLREQRQPVPDLCGPPTTRWTTRRTAAAFLTLPTLAWPRT